MAIKTQIGVRAETTEDFKFDMRLANFKDEDLLAKNFSNPGDTSELVATTPNEKAIQARMTRNTKVLLMLAAILIATEYRTTLKLRAAGQYWEESDV